MFDYYDFMLKQHVIFFITIFWTQNKRGCLNLSYEFASVSACLAVGPFLSFQVSVKPKKKINNLILYVC
jgi:hypothetical protein